MLLEIGSKISEVTANNKAVMHEISRVNKHYAFAGKLKFKRHLESKHIVCYNPENNGSVFVLLQESSN